MALMRNSCINISLVIMVSNLINFQRLADGGTESEVFLVSDNQAENNKQQQQKVRSHSRQNYAESVCKRLE